MAFKIRATVSVCWGVSDAAWIDAAMAMALLRATRLFVLLAALIPALIAIALDTVGVDAVDDALSVAMRCRATLISGVDVVLPADTVPTKRIRLPSTSVEVDEIADAMADSIMSVAIVTDDVLLDALIVEANWRATERIEFVFVEVLTLIVAPIRYAIPRAALLVVVAFAVIVAIIAFAMLMSASDGVELAAAATALKANMSFRTEALVELLAFIVALIVLMIDNVGESVVTAAFTVATILLATAIASLDVVVEPERVAAIDRATFKTAEF